MKVSGNVMTTVNDRKVYDGSNFVARVISAQTYYPFGMPETGRQVDASLVRRGYQGQETDNEIKGDSNSVNYKYRVHDPRLGRFFSIDPLAPEYLWNSPYAFSENSVVAFIELEGLEKTEAGKEKRYEHHFIENYSHWEDGFRVYITYPSTNELIKLYHGNTNKICLITYDQSMGFTRSYPERLVEPMKSKPVALIPITSPMPEQLVMRDIDASEKSRATKPVSPSPSGVGDAYNIPLGTPQNLNVQFVPSSAIIVSNAGLRDMVNILNNNPKVNATISSSTDLPEDNAGKLLLVQRKLSLMQAIINIDPNFDLSRITPEQAQYKTSHSATVTYSTSDKKK